MGRTITLTCDEPECITKGHCPEDSGEILERTFEHNGYEYEMDLDEISFAIREKTLEELRKKFEADVKKLEAKFFEAAEKVLAPAIQAGRTRPITPEPSPASSSGAGKKSTATALDRAVKWARSQHPTLEQPNAKRQRVAQKFVDWFVAKEDAWEGWKEGDPIPDGWVDDGTVCKLADPNAKV